MTPTEAAWLAGYIDGDGCISITKRHGSQWRVPIINADSADMELLTEVQRLVGGNIVKKTKYKDHHRQAYTWRLCAADKAIAICIAILPYMKCEFKKERAQMLVDKWRDITPANGWYTDAMRQRKTDFEQQFLESGEGRGRRMIVQRKRG